jgi:LacI family repressor for deo operon, udp, cdd, tsx, nupC, and nupG
VDGALISVWNARSAARSLPPGLPHVSLLLAPEGVPSVVADDYGGARDGIERLIGLGHRRIACLLQHTVTANWANLPGLVDGLAPGRLRLGGYFEALQKAGIEPVPELIRDPGPPRHEGYREWGRIQVERWLEEDWRELKPTALFVQNDLAAIGAVQAFREAGLRVPHDVSVLSFDGTEVCEIASPTIAAIHVPLAEIGARAVEVLLHQIKTGRIEPVTTVLETRFKPGESIGPPAEGEFPM